MVKGKILLAVQGSVPSTAKVTRFWHNDGPSESVNSISVLMSWLTTEGNYSRWRGGDKFSGVTKKSLASSIVNLIHDQVGVTRTQKHVINKIGTIEADYRSASDWLGATGSGVVCQISVREYVMKLCPFFYDLQDVMEDRASTKPLFSSGCELEQDDEVMEDESKPEATGLKKIVETLLHSDDDEDFASFGKVSTLLFDIEDDNKEGDGKQEISNEIDYPLLSPPNEKKGSAKKRIKGVLPRSNSQFKGEDDEMSQMIHLKWKQLDDEAERRKESFRFQQLEVE